MGYNRRLVILPPAPQSAELRPLDFPGLMAEAFRAYARNFGLWFGIAACYEAATLPLHFLEPSLGKNLLSVLETPGAAYFVGQLELLGRALGLDVISFCAFQIALAALAYAFAARMIGRPVSLAAAYRRALERVPAIMGAVALSLVLPFGAWGSVALAAIALGLAASTVVVVVMHSTGALAASILMVTVLMILAALPAVIYLTLRITLAMPVLAAENCGARASLERSYALSKGRVLRILAVVVLTGLLVLMATSLVELPFEIAELALKLQRGTVPFWIRLLGASLTRAGAALALPPLMLALTLAYLDLRVRKEALTIERLRRDVTEVSEE